ncbi:MAG TPA: cytidine deaminase [Candidatus Baltobacteraceae bacterium]|jgi:cytidine deaminase
MPAASELLAAARKAREHAYAPYSNFAVGAALATKAGDVVTGANVENASYPVGMCAERTALFSAVARGHRDFDAIAIVGPEGVALTPCGACRQALSEFGDMRVVREGCDDVALRDLLPDAFGPRHLARTGI